MPSCSARLTRLLDTCERIGRKCGLNGLQKPPNSCRPGEWKRESRSRSNEGSLLNCPCFVRRKVFDDPRRECWNIARCKAPATCWISFHSDASIGHLEGGSRVPTVELGARCEIASAAVWGAWAQRMIERVRRPCPLSFSTPPTAASSAVDQRACAFTVCSKRAAFFPQNATVGPGPAMCAFSPGPRCSARRYRKYLLSCRYQGPTQSGAKANYSRRTPENSTGKGVNRLWRPISAASAWPEPSLNTATRSPSFPIRISSHPPSALQPPSWALVTG